MQQEISTILEGLLLQMFMMHKVLYKLQAQWAI